MPLIRLGASGGRLTYGEISVAAVDPRRPVVRDIDEVEVVDDRVAEGGGDYIDNDGEEPRCTKPFGGMGFGDRVEAVEKGRVGFGEARAFGIGERDKEVGGREGIEWFSDGMGGVRTEARECMISTGGTGVF